MRGGYLWAAYPDELLGQVSKFCPLWEQPMCAKKNKAHACGDTGIIQDLHGVPT